MLKIKTTHKILSRREYDRLHWQLRTAHSYAEKELIREELLNHLKRDFAASIIVVSSGTTHFPEHWYLAAMLSVFRRSGFIDDDTRLLLIRSKDRDVLEITLEYDK